MVNLNGHETGNGGNSQGEPNVFSNLWQGYANPTGSETVARYQKGIAGTRETQSVLRKGVCDDKSINDKLLQKMLWESDWLIVVMKRGNACGAKGLAGESLEQGHFLRTLSRIKKDNKIVSKTLNRKALLKSRMRENFKSGSVRGLIVSPMDCKIQRRWL